MSIYRSLGTSGLVVSAIGLGCNNLGRANTATETQEGATALITQAIDAGVTFFDVADVYGSQPGQSETFLGEALKGKRDNVVVATKFGMDLRGANGPDWGARGSRRYIRTAVEASLRRLNTEYIDLYQYHQPDNITPIEETLSTLHDLVSEGKVRYIGHSNFPGWKIAQADAVAHHHHLAPFVSAQNQFSLLRREVEREILPAVNAHSLALIPYFPLSNGLLTGKYTGGKRPGGTRLTDLKPDILQNAPWDALEKLADFAASRGIGEVDVAFGWLLSHPAISTVIAGATKPEQIVRNVQAAQWQASPADLEELDTIFPGFAPEGGFKP